MSRRATIRAIGLLAILAALAAWAIDLRARAGAARDAATRAARAPGFAVARGEGLDAPDEPAGGRRLAALVADRGSAAGVRLAVRPVADADAPGLAVADLEATGSERALRGLARAIEGERPIVRLSRWSLGPAGGGRLRLAARAVAPLATGPSWEADAIPIRVVRAGSAERDGAPLFATGSADSAPRASRTAPPQLIGIVGRLPAPTAMVRLADGSVRTLAVGGAAGEWRLVAVAADRARFRRGREERVAVLPPRAEAQ